MLIWEDFSCILQEKLQGLIMTQRLKMLTAIWPPTPSSKPLYLPFFAAGGIKQVAATLEKNKINNSNKGSALTIRLFYEAWRIVETYSKRVLPSAIYFFMVLPQLHYVGGWLTEEFFHPSSFSQLQQESLIYKNRVMQWAGNDTFWWSSIKIYERIFVFLNSLTCLKIACLWEIDNFTQKQFFMLALWTPS